MPSPVVPAQSSFTLARRCCWSVTSGFTGDDAAHAPRNEQRLPAIKDQLYAFFDHLSASQRLRVPVNEEVRPTMVRNLEHGARAQLYRAGRFAPCMAW